MHGCEIGLHAAEAMEAEVRETVAGIPPLMKEPTEENMAVLRHIALQVAGTSHPTWP